MTDGYIDGGKFVPTKTNQQKDKSPSGDLKIIIAVMDENNSIHPNTTPRNFGSIESAIKAAESMSTRHGKNFVVLTEVARVVAPTAKPKVIISKNPEIKVTMQKQSKETKPAAKASKSDIHQLGYRSVSVALGILEKNRGKFMPLNTIRANMVSAGFSEKTASGSMSILKKHGLVQSRHDNTTAVEYAAV